MNPLAIYLLSVLKRQQTCATKEFVESQMALSELGYWCLSRPAGYPRDRMLKCKISLECQFVEEFSSYTPPLEGLVEGFDTIIEVYAEEWAE